MLGEMSMLTHELPVDGFGLAVIQLIVRGCSVLDLNVKFVLRYRGGVFFRRFPCGAENLVCFDTALLDLFDFFFGVCFVCGVTYIWVASCRILCCDMCSTRWCVASKDHGGGLRFMESRFMVLSATQQACYFGWF